MILSLMTQDDLMREARETRFPKWNTLCLLRSLGLPTLDAVFIPPRADHEYVIGLADDFAHRIQKDKLLLRSDGGREEAAYPFGGNSFPIGEAVLLCKQLLERGRAILLMEPTDRFSNRMTVQLVASVRGGLGIEILGPGFDASDLTRGGIIPQYAAEVRLGSWLVHECLWSSDISLRELGQHASRRRERLLNLGLRVLPSIGGRSSGIR